MKKRHFIFYFFGLISLFMQFSCTTDKGDEEFILNKIAFSNVTAVFNLSRTHIHFGSLTDSSGRSAIMAAHGDLLFLMFEEESLFMRYNIRNGNSIDIAIDTVCNKRFYEQDDLVALYLTEDSFLMDWLDSLDGQTFNQLRTLQLTLPLSERCRIHVQKIVTECTGAGLVLECDSSVTEEDIKILQSLSPQWVYLTDCQFNMLDPLVVSLFREVELLGVEGEDIQWTLSPDAFPNLTSLILKNWNPLKTGIYALPNTEFLQSVTLVEPNITSVSFLTEIPELKNLHVVCNDTLSDIGSLYEVSSLNSLGFPFCTKITDIQPMLHLRSLKWVSLPVKTKPEEFSQIYTSFPDLQVLELIACEEINDLSPVVALASLQCLIIDLPGVDMTPLTAMTNLRLLVIEENRFEESVDTIAEIMEALPGLQVLPGGGLCMGSGWILLLFPMLFFIWLFRRSKKFHELKNR